jgi:hypothetical protein
MVPTKKPFYPGHMENGTIYTLISLVNFKPVLDIDDREDALSRYCLTTGAVQRGDVLFDHENLVESNHCYCLPDEGIREDIPFSLVLRPSLYLTRKEMGIRIRYVAGYVPGKTPADMASVYLKLAAWNMVRYRGRQIGMTGDRGYPGERKGWRTS